jgi:uncharacterized protein YecT (DUF1311 family)
MRLVTIALAMAAIAQTSGSGAAAAAGPTDYGKAYDDCLTKAGGASNASVGLCAEEVTIQADGEMKRLYQKAHQRIGDQSPEDAAKLEGAQASWLAYRNAHCALAGQYVGSPMYSYCPMTLGIQRVGELREMAGE